MSFAACGAGSDGSPKRTVWPGVTLSLDTMKLISTSLLIAATAAAALAACSGATAPFNGRLPAGAWSGPHMGMAVTDTGASITFDCAAGRVNGPLTLGADGRFDWSGTFAPGHGGPVPVGTTEPSYAARYTGRATRIGLTVTLSLVDTAFTPQTYTLVRGGNADVLKCL